MKQDDMFDICRNRHGGSQESKVANLRVAPVKQDQRRRVLAACRRPQGVTCRELAEEWGVGMNRISGRFSELKQDGLIHKAGVRDGSGVMVAVPVANGEASDE